MKSGERLYCEENEEGKGMEVALQVLLGLWFGDH